MNKLLKFKAGDVLRNNHKLVLLCVSFFVLTIRFSLITGLSEAEESSNEDLDFKKNKWQFMKSQIVLLPAMKLWENFKSLIFFTGRHRLDYLPIYPCFNINFACCHIQKFIIALLWAELRMSHKGKQVWKKEENSKPQWLFCVLTVLIVKPSET